MKNEMKFIKKENFPQTKFQMMRKEAGNMIRGE